MPVLIIQISVGSKICVAIGHVVEACAGDIVHFDLAYTLST